MISEVDIRDWQESHWKSAPKSLDAAYERYAMDQGLVKNPVFPENKIVVPNDAKQRKAIPIASGVLDYFPLALMEVAKTSKAGNDQHHPGKPLHWEKDKSTDHADCILRHMIDRGTIDTDGIRHSAKVAWRALAMLQTEMEAL
jgi:Domain of unknown function (DUF5664)